MSKQQKTDLRTLVGNAKYCKKLNATDFFYDQFGLPTIQDIISELAKPGRDPRSELRIAKSGDQVNDKQT